MVINNNIIIKKGWLIIGRYQPKYGRAYWVSRSLTDVRIRNQNQTIEERTQIGGTEAGYKLWN